MGIKKGSAEMQSCFLSGFGIFTGINPQQLNICSNPHRDKAAQNERGSDKRL
jgi:hypothetical protein